MALTPTKQPTTGVLGTTQLPLYKVPQGSYAIVSGLSFCCTGATGRVVDIYIHEPGSTARRVRRVYLEGGAPTSSSVPNHIALGSDRWVITEGTTIEAVQGAGADVEWHLSILERVL